jgi:hypothetical protein
MLEDEFKIPCVRGIHVTLNAKGKKVPVGENNSLTPDQIANDRGNPSGNTLSIYVKHLPGIAVIDFDTKELDDCELWKLCCERMYLRCETRGGYHCYVRCNVPPGTKEQDVGKGVKLDLIHDTRNVWETQGREFEGEMQAMEWDELKSYLTLPSTVRRGTFDELVSAACGVSIKVPPVIAAWVSDKFGSVVKCASKAVESAGRKRKHTEVTELKFTTASHEIRVQQEADGEVTYVGVSKLQQSSAEDLRQLLTMISPDVSRDDWLRVGNFLKHETSVNGFELWSEWSRRSEQCSSKLPYEWQMLGGGTPCTLGTLIYLARKENEDGVAQWQRTSGNDEPEVARTKEALDYAGVLEWNQHCVYIEATHSYLWLNGDSAPINISKDHGVSNNMKRYSTLPLADWLSHPDATRYRSQGYFPSRTPTPEQLAPDVYNCFMGMGIEREDAVAGDVAPLLKHIHEILCAGNQDHSQYLLNCMAHMVQYPWRRLNVCIVMISEEGAGKSIVWSHFMGGILGNNYLSQGNHNAVLGQFNDCLSGKILINCEELVWGGHGVGVLKDLLTSDTLFINRKNCQPWTERNFVNLVICTNGNHAVPASLSARRFFVLQPSNRYSGAQSAAARAWFDRVLQVDVKAFAHYLYNRNLDGFCPRNVPLTEALTQQKHRSMDATDCVLHEWLTRGYVMDSCTTWRLDAELTLPRSGWFKRAHSEFGHVRNFPNNPQTFWNNLKRTLTTRDGECLLRVANEGRRVVRKLQIQRPGTCEIVDGPSYNDRWYTLPSLEDARAFWVREKCASETWV